MVCFTAKKIEALLQYWRRQWPLAVDIANVKINFIAKCLLCEDSRCGEARINFKNETVLSKYHELYVERPARMEIVYNV